MLSVVCRRYCMVVQPSVLWIEVIRALMAHDQMMVSKSIADLVECSLQMKRRKSRNSRCCVQSSW
jgi:hypothetical protein